MSLFYIITDHNPLIYSNVKKSQATSFFMFCQENGKWVQRFIKNMQTCMEIKAIFDPLSSRQE